MAAEDDDQEEAQALRMPEPEPEPEVVVPPPGSGGFSTDAESGGGGGSIYGALSAPAVGLGSGSGRPSGGGSGNSLRVSLAISRLPPFVTAEGDLSGVIGAPSSSGSGSGKKSGGSGGRGSKGGGSSLEMAPMAGATGGLEDGGGFTIAEGTVLPKGKGKKTRMRFAEEVEVVGVADGSYDRAPEMPVEEAVWLAEEARAAREAARWHDSEESGEEEDWVMAVRQEGSLDGWIPR